MKYPAYPKYKDSGVEWLGEIPERWAASKLKYSIAQNDGGAWGDDPTGNDTDRIVLRSTEQNVDGTWNIIDPAFRALSDREFNSTKVRKGDLLITKSSGSSYHIGKTSLVTQKIESLQCSYSNFMQRLRVNEYILPEYLWFILNNEIAREQFNFSSNSTIGLSNLNSSIFNDLLIPLPPRSTQQSISTFLDTETAKIDGLIKDYEELISLLQEKRQALISHAVTRGLSELVSPDDAEFGEWAKPVKFKDSGVEWLGEIPQDWNISESRWLFSERKERAGIDDRQVTASQKYGIIYQEEFMEMENQKVMLVMKDFSILKKVKPNDFVISMRSFQGGLEISEVEGCMSSAYIALIPDLHFVNPSYFKWAFKSVKYIQALQNTTNFVRDGQALRYGNFTQIKLPVIPINEQKAIGSFLEKEVEFIDSLCVETQDAISLLKEHRSALITNAVTGKINVEALV